MAPSGRYGWECEDCGRVVSIYNRAYHRNTCPNKEEYE